MTHRKHVRIAVVMGVGIITVLGGLLALSASERFLFTEYLRVEAYTPDNHDSLSAKQTVG